MGGGSGGRRGQLSTRLGRQRDTACPQPACDARRTKASRDVCPLTTSFAVRRSRTLRRPARPEMPGEIRTEIKKAKLEGKTTSTKKKVKVEGSTKKKVMKAPKAAEPEAAEPKRKRARAEESPRSSPRLSASKAPAEPPAVELAEPKKDSAKKPAKKAKRSDDVDEDEAVASTFQDDVRGDPALALEKFDFSADTLAALRARGVESLFPIQAATFKLIKEGKDVIGRARTGMGKG